MRCFKVTIEYDGTDYAGFQYQVGQRSVQAVIENAVGKLTKQPVRVNGAGRTDAGVHAMGQVVSFRADTKIPIEKLAVAMNSVLPSDITATTADEVDESFHARFSAKSRAYVYVILNRSQPSAVFGRFTYNWQYPLDIQAMQDGARYLLGSQDFAAWANDTREVRTTVRNVIQCRVKPVKSFVLVQIEANAFLKGMVRNVVGTLLEVGAGKRQPDSIPAITQTRNRANAGPAAPARGLCMVRVRY